MDELELPNDNGTIYTGDTVVPIGSSYRRGLVDSLTADTVTVYFGNSLETFPADQIEKDPSWGGDIPLSFMRQK